MESAETGKERSWTAVGMVDYTKLDSQINAMVLQHIKS